MGLFVSNKNVTYVCLFHWSSFQHLSDSKLCLKKSVLFWHQSQLPYLNTRLLEVLVYHIQSQGLVLITLVYFKILFHVVGFVKYNIKILLLLLFFFSCFDINVVLLGVATIVVTVAKEDALYFILRKWYAFIA